MHWLRKVGQPGKPAMLGLEMWIYGLVGLVLVVAYFISRF